MRYLYLLLLYLPSLSLFAQDEQVWEEPSPESRAYHETRIRHTIPPYGLAKVKQLQQQIRNDEDENLKLSDKAYQALSLREKFTYHMLHAETYSQNCDVMSPVMEEQKKIFGYLPDAFDEYSWSDRQLKFLTGNRDSVMALIRESVTRSKKTGLNYKHAIIAINGWEMIPFLIKTYKTDRSDHDLLTVLMLLMNENKYPPFMASPSWKKLYGPESGYQAFIVYHKANEDLILGRAAGFYNSRK